MRDRSVAGRSALIGTIALLLGACGGSDDGSTVTVTDTAPPSGRAAYIAEADALCARVATEAGDLAESAEELRSIQESDPRFHPAAAAHFERVLEIATGARDEFAALEPPEPDRDRIDELNEVNDEAVEVLRTMVAAFRGGETPRDESEEYASLLAQADRLAKAYGFEVCARIS
jgi:hypothetical protein